MVPGPPRQWSGAQRQLWPGQSKNQRDPLRACGAAVPGGPPAGGAAAPGVPVCGPRPPQAVVPGSQRTRGIRCELMQSDRLRLTGMSSCSYRGSATRRRHCAGGPRRWSPALQAAVPGRGDRHGPSAPSGAQHLVQNSRKRPAGGPRPLPSLTREVARWSADCPYPQVPGKKYQNIFKVSAVSPGLPVCHIPRSPAHCYIPRSLRHLAISPGLRQSTEVSWSSRGRPREAPRRIRREARCAWSF